MFGPKFGQPVEDLQNRVMGVADFICSVISEPVEIIAVRPWYGTRYFPLPVKGFSLAMVILLPGVASLFTDGPILPFLSPPPPRGMFGLGSFSELYLLVSFAQGIRVWRKILHPELEAHSQSAGPALPFFAWLWKGDSYYAVRIFWEPLFVWLLSIVLEDIYIIQHPLALYLRVAAFALMLKSTVAFHQEWEHFRIRRDVQVEAPRIAAFMNQQTAAGDDEPIPIAGYPEAVPDDARPTRPARGPRACVPGKSWPPESSERKTQ